MQVLFFSLFFFFFTLNVHQLLLGTACARGQFASPLAVWREQDKSPLAYPLCLVKQIHFAPVSEHLEEFAKEFWLYSAHSLLLW